MTRAARARRIAAAAAYGGGGIGMLGVTAYSVVRVEARMARRWIGQPFALTGPGGEGEYSAAHVPEHVPEHVPGSESISEPITLVMLGDSTSVGIGVDAAADTPGVRIAEGLAAISGRPVRLRVGGMSGSESSALPGQVAAVLDDVPFPQVAVIMIGANDVTHRIRPADAVRDLSAAVRRLREVGAEVVVGTCPDLGTVRPLAHPLRYIARRYSRELAAAQTIATIEAGGRTVSLGDLLGPEFEASPAEMFSADRFHPSAAGYARAAGAIIPTVAAVLGFSADGAPERSPVIVRHERVDDVAHAAVEAVDSAGTEVSGTSVAGAQRGPRGRWAVLLRRRGSAEAPPGAEPLEPDLSTESA